MAKCSRFGVDNLLSPSFARTLAEDISEPAKSPVPSDIFKIDVDSYLSLFQEVPPAVAYPVREKAALQPLSDNTLSARQQRALGIKQNPVQIADLKRRQVGSTAARFGFTKH